MGERQTVGRRREREKIEKQVRTWKQKSERSSEAEFRQVKAQCSMCVRVCVSRKKHAHTHTHTHTHKQV